MARGHHGGGFGGHHGGHMSHGFNDTSSASDPHWSHGGHHGGHGGMLLGVWAFCASFPNLSRALTLLVLLWLLK